jgi:Ca2+-binding EF-hand superfamily protein
MNATNEALLLNLRMRLAKRGTRGISSISKKFKIADDNGNGTLDKEEFKKAMSDFRIGMNDKQISAVFDMFDRDGYGDISYDEFLRMIRG